MKRTIFEYVLFLFDEFFEDIFECQSGVLLFFRVTGQNCLSDWVVGKRQ